MNNQYITVKDTRKVKWTIAIVIFILINIISNIYFSTEYINKLLKINGVEISKKIKEMITPFIRGNKSNYYMYLPFGNWEILMKKTPKLTGDFQFMIFIIFIISLIFLTIPFWKKRKLTSCGTAEWGSYTDLKKNPRQASDVNFLENDGVVIGVIKYAFRKVRLLFCMAGIHMLLVIPSRGGKGVSFIILSLIEGLKKYSTFTTDIKKENFEKTSWYRAKVLGHKVLKIEFLSDLSTQYNFLTEVDYGTKDEIKDCRLVGLNIVGEDKSNDPYWGDNARDIISTLSLYVHYKDMSRRKEEELEISDVRCSLNDVVTLMTDPSRSLYEMFANYIGKDLSEDEEEEVSIGIPNDFILKDKTIEELKRIYTDSKSQELLDKGLHPFIAKQFAYFLTNMTKKTLQTISSVAKTKLQVFEIPSVAKNISKSDFRINELVNGDVPVDLYYVLTPEDIQLLAPLTRLMVVQISNKLMRTLTKNKFILKMILDEFAAFGRMSEVENNLGYYAGYGIELFIILQGMDQLISTYTENNKILSGCQIQIFGRPNDKIVPNYVSEKLGRKTIKKASRNIGMKGGGSVSEGGRELLTKDEVNQLPDDVSIVFTGFKKPLLLDRIRYYKYPKMLEKTEHQPLFTKNGKIIFEKVNKKYLFEFTMDEKDFYSDKYDNIISQIRKKLNTNSIA